MPDSKLGQESVGMIHLCPMWSVGVTSATVLSYKLGMDWSIHDGLSFFRASLYMASNSIA